LNIDPKKIIIVYPNEETKKKLNRFDCFNNPYVSNLMRSVLANLGIRVYEAFFMKEWNGGEWEPGHPVKSVIFEKVRVKNSEKSEEYIDFDCDVIIF
jgi:hypothetical protein